VISRALYPVFNAKYPLPPELAAVVSLKKIVVGILQRIRRVVITLKREQFLFCRFSTAEMSLTNHRKTDK
jgi:hypothetical protein